MFFFFVVLLSVVIDRQRDGRFVLPPSRRFLFRVLRWMTGLADLSSFHFVTPLLPKLDKLLGQGFPPEASTLALQLCNNDLNAAVTIMERTPLQERMTYRLTLSPRSLEGFSPNRGGLRSKSISVVSPGSLLESDQVRTSLSLSLSGSL